MTELNDTTGGWSKALDELLGLYDGFGNVTVAAEHSRHAPLAHGWYQQARRTTRALRVLETAGWNHEGAPLRRLLIELTLGLGWLTHAGDAAVDSLLRAWENNREKLRDAVRGGDWSVEPELLSAGSPLDLDPSTKSGDRNLHVKHQSELLDGNVMYVGWMLETSRSHACAALAEEYLSPDDGPAGMALLSEPGSPPTEMGVVAALLLQATSHFHALLVGTPWAEQLERIDKDLRESSTTQRNATTRHLD